MHKAAAFLGFVIIIFIAYLISNNKKKINWKTFAWGIGLQFAFALMVLRGVDIMNLMSYVMPGRMRFYAIPLILLIIAYFIITKITKERSDAIERNFLIFRWAIWGALLLIMLRWNLLERFFSGAREAVHHLINFASEGAGFVFGPLATSKDPVYFAFAVLPTIIFVASIFAVLYYYGIMQKIVKLFARLMMSIMGTSGAESTSVAASIFMGQTEAPLTIRPFLSKMTMSELMTMMTAGMAHVSGSIMAAYVMIAGVDIKHLLAAVIMTAPGAIFMSKLMVPEVDQPETGASPDTGEAQEINVEVEVTDVNVIDAAARGASEGLQLALNVAGMLVAFIALVAMLNGILGGVHNLLAGWLGESSKFATFFPSSLQQILGFVFAPLAAAMGVPWKDALPIGDLMGTRMVLNEFVAFIKLGELSKAGLIDPRSFTIATYALCGFANLSSIAIQVGGIGALAPDRRHDLAKLGVKAMIAGTLANFLTATIAGMLL